MLDSPKDILKKYWGFDAFRPLQEEIIFSVLDGKDTLALLPTGGGKSICFQIPALCQKGLCLVVSPLISLMKDQVENLNNKGIKAIAISSAMNKREIDIALDNCVYGDTKFLYLSPERLASDLFKERLKKMNISLIAVDEAHCISQWGYDFRPSYLKISELKELLPKTPVVALTATATAKVVIDIQEKLNFKTPNVFQKSFFRSNLSYSVLYESNKYLKLDGILSKVKGSTIIYARNRRHTQDITTYLKSKNYSAEYYHAGLTNKQRDDVQSRWMNDKTRIIVATNAFGMGIDKPNVRLVIHLDLPDSLEAYFQEAGRAGRDEKKAYAVLIYDEIDKIKLEEKILLDYPEISFIRNVYQAIGNHYQLAIGSGLEENFEFNISEFCHKYNFKVTETFSALKILALNEYIFLTDAFYSPSRIKINISKGELYQFQLKNSNFDSILKLILRSYSSVFDDYKTIDENVLSKRSGLSLIEISKSLNQLKNLEVVNYIPKTSLPKVTFIQERKDHKKLSISPISYQNRKDEAILKAKKITEYASLKNRCRSFILLAYFGEEISENCGVCDFCTGRHNNNSKTPQIDKLKLEVLQELKGQSLSTTEIVVKLNQHKKESVIECLRWMIDENLIKLTKSKYSKINL